MAIIKHIPIKNANYTDAIHYLIFQHDEYTQVEIVDEYDVPLLRDNYILEGINCDPYAYDFECSELNRSFHKNRSRDDIKEHHYIISFDPKDVSECGLSCEKAQALGMEYAKRNFPGHQTLVCTHDDGHNHSGNIHVHIVFNSLRKYDVDEKPFMERGCDHKAGYKHHSTPKFLKYLKSDLMQLCQREHLHQVDLLRPARKRITEREYYANRRANAASSTNHTKDSNPGKFESQKDYLRRAIEDCAKKAHNEKEFKTLLHDKYNVTLEVSRGRYGYIHPDRNKPIRGRMLGTDYEEGHLISVFERNASRTIARESQRENPRENQNRNQNENSAIAKYRIPKALTMSTALPLVKDLQKAALSSLSGVPDADDPQYNSAYIKKVQLTNLKKMAETIAYAQEHDLHSMDMVDASYDKAIEELQSSKKSLNNVKQQLQSVNEQIHYTGKYLSTKKIYNQYRLSKDKNSFYNKYRGEIANHEAAREYLKEKSAYGKLPTLSDLKTEKARLLKERDTFYDAYNDKLAAYHQIDTVKRNIEAILAMPDELQQPLISHSRTRPVQPSR